MGGSDWKLWAFEESITGNLFHYAVGSVYIKKNKKTSVDVMMSLCSRYENGDYK